MKTPHSNLEFRIALPSNVGQTRSHHCNDNGLYGFIDKVGLNLWELSEIPDDLSPNSEPSKQELEDEARRA